MLRKFQQADEIMYEYFEKQFEKLVTDFGKDWMAASIQSLRKLTQKKEEECKFKKDTENDHAYRAKIIDLYRLKNEKVWFD